MFLVFTIGSETRLLNAYFTYDKKGKELKSVTYSLSTFATGPENRYRAGIVLFLSNNRPGSNFYKYPFYFIGMSYPNSDSCIPKNCSSYSFNDSTKGLDTGSVTPSFSLHLVSMAWR